MLMCDVTGTTDTPRKSANERGESLFLCEIFEIQQFHATSFNREKGVERSHALRKLGDCYYFRASPPEYLVSLQYEYFEWPE